MAWEKRAGDGDRDREPCRVLGLRVWLKRRTEEQIVTISDWPNRAAAAAMNGKSWKREPLV